MPKRSNDFQRLVKVIHDAFASMEGAKVSESAMLPEPDGTLREVDILVERRFADVHFRLAIECRDRSRKGDVDWIDGLVGKFRNLPVDKVIAVCRLGFSNAAVAKAAANKIELRVLQQCMTHKWPDEFLKLGLAAFEFAPVVRSFQITFNPFLAEPTLDLATEIPECVATLSLDAVVRIYILQKVIPGIKNYLQNELLSNGRTLADLTRKWEFIVSMDIHGVSVVTPSGSRHQITKMSFDILAESRATPSNVGHFKYGDTALASAGDLDFEVETYKMKIIQVAGNKDLTVNIVKGDSSPRRAE